MSKKDKYDKLSAGLGSAIDSIAPTTKSPSRPDFGSLTPSSAPKSAPGQLMAFTKDRLEYETKIKALESEVADLKRIEIPLDLIDMNPWQPRTFFDPKEIEELAASIGEVGLIQPVIVRRVSTRDTKEAGASVSSRGTRFELIAGERRLRAHKYLGKTEIKAVILEANDQDLAVMALAENLDRADLSDYEIGKAVRRAEKEFPNRKHMAEAIGIGRAQLYRYLSFDSLPQIILDDLDVNPKLLGSNVAQSIVSYIKDKGDAARDAIVQVWPKVKMGQLDQMKITQAAEASLANKPVRTDRDIRKLFVDQVQAGSITRDQNTLTVKIKTGLLSEQKESKLREYIQSLLIEPEPK
jgi:ParB family chromosome partitioning protein